MTMDGVWFRIWIYWTHTDPWLQAITPFSLIHTFYTSLGNTLYSQAVQWWFVFVIPYHLIFKLVFIWRKHLENSLFSVVTIIINFQIEWFKDFFVFYSFYTSQYTKRDLYILIIYQNSLSSLRLTMKMKFNFPFSSYRHFNFILHYTK